MYITGLDPEKRTSTPEFAPLDMGFNKGKGYVYGKAQGAIDKNDFVEVFHTDGMASLDQGNDRVGTQVAVATEAFTNNQWGWFQVYGDSTGNFKNAVQDVKLYSTSTDGHLDASSSGSQQVAGVFLVAARTGGDGPARCILNFPTII